jgi:hypothetical protein
MSRSGMSRSLSKLGGTGVAGGRSYAAGRFSSSLFRSLGSHAARTEGAENAKLSLRPRVRRRDPGSPITIVTSAALTLRHAPVPDWARWTVSRGLSARQPMVTRCARRSRARREPRFELSVEACISRTAMPLPVLCDLELRQPAPARRACATGPLYCAITACVGPS